MQKDMTDYIVTLLETYTKTTKKIKLPHDVAGIAICFREIAEQMKQETMEEISAQFA